MAAGVKASGAKTVGIGSPGIFHLPFTTYVATAYGPPWNRMEGTGVTSGGPGGKGGHIDLRKNPDAKVIAAGGGSGLEGGDLVAINPNPYGDTKIQFLVADTGGRISGNHIDIYIKDSKKRDNWGKKNVKVLLLKKSGDPLTDPCKQIPGLCGPGAPGAPGISNPIKDVAEAIIRIIAKLFDPNTWVDIGKMLLGILAIAVGVHMLMRGGPTLRAVRTAKRATIAGVVAKTVNDSSKATRVRSGGSGTTTNGVTLR